MQQTPVETALPVAPQEQPHKHGAPEHSAIRAGWYILRCGGGLELRAREALADAGWDAFLPVERKWRASLLRRKPVEVAYPRFPRYLFVRVAPPVWPPFRRRPLSAYVRGVLAMAGRPVPLAPGEIERLKAEDGALVVPTASLHKAFVPGMQVRVRHGPFESFTAALDAIDDEGARITVQLLGRPTPVRQPLAWLEAAA